MDALDNGYPIPDTRYLTSIPRFRGDRLAPAEAGDRVSRNEKQAAEDFESLLLGKILEEMKNTIGEWGFETDGISKQVQGIFWLYLAQDIANKGGFGLWKDIYEFLANSEPANTRVESLNKNL